MTYTNPHGPSCPWYDITVKTGAPNIKWCEETLCQWVSEPANTWSNLGYLIVGIIILVIGIKRGHNSNMKQFGPIIFFMGAMSFFYHQSNFYGSQILDFIGMFLFLGWAIGMNLIRVRRIRPHQLWSFNLILCSCFTLIMHGMYLLGYKFQAVVLISGFVIMWTEWKAAPLAKVHYKYLFSTIFILIIGFGFSIADGQRLWCDPKQHGLFAQGHAIWHWVTTFAMMTLYLHFSQDSLKPSAPLQK